MSARLTRILALVVLLGASCACTAAIDLNAPWWRGLPGTTYATWEFSTPDLHPLPDVCVNPNGIPQMDIFPGHEWEQLFFGRYGVWPLSGLIAVDIPNFPPPNPFKEVVVQVTWASLSPYAEPDVDELLTHLSFHLVSREPVPPDQGLQWWHDTYRLTIIPNPPHEVIRVQGAIWVDELVIDTMCAPEPSCALAILGGCAGLFGLIRRRR